LLTKRDPEASRWFAPERRPLGSYWFTLSGAGRLQATSDFMEQRICRIFASRHAISDYASELGPVDVITGHANG